MRPVHFQYKKVKKRFTRILPNLVENPGEIEESFVHFKDFCNLYRDEITSILKSKLVQTNEVRLCAPLSKLLLYLGLENNEIYGDRNSTVPITFQIKGNNDPIFLQDSPRLLQRLD